MLILAVRRPDILVNNAGPNGPTGACADENGTVLRVAVARRRAVRQREYRPGAEREYLAWPGTIIGSRKAAILAGSMTAAEFVNYPAEWRHWLYDE